MRTGRNTHKIARLIKVLTTSPPMKAGDIAAAAEMSHEAVLDWLYTLHAEGLVDAHTTTPRKWSWRHP